MTHCHPQHTQSHKKKPDSQRSSQNLTAFVLVVLIAGIGLAFFWFGAERPKASLDDTVSSGPASLSVEPKEIDMGTVEMSLGITERTFSLKNTGTGSLRVSDLKTSCMCTSAQLEVDGKKSQKFGMAGMGAAPTSWSMEIPAGGEGTLHAFYDPNAHGPAGVGLIERSILFTTNDSAQQNVEVRIRGAVVP